MRSTAILTFEPAYGRELYPGELDEAEATDEREPDDEGDELDHGEHDEAVGS